MCSLFAGRLAFAFHQEHFKIDAHMAAIDIESETELDIFLNNQDAHLEVLGRFTEELFSLQRAIRKKDGEYLLKYFERTRSIRKGIVAAGQDTGTPNFGRD